MIQPQKELCVAHLVRAHNGIAPLKRFLDSYQTHPGGMEHDLLIVFKGFESPSEKDEYLKVLAPFQHYSLDVPDAGFDISAYFVVVQRYAAEYNYFCFLNSFSEILDSGWLSKLHHHISRPGVGLVGATGSWESHRLESFILRDIFDVAQQHYGVYKNKPFWRRAILGGTAARDFYRSVDEGLWDNLGDYLLSLIYFQPFPNYHLRTNAFMISSRVMSSLKCPVIKDKMDAYRFEGGRSGLTRQIMRKRMKVLVVGRDGGSYEKENWNTSSTFRRSEQKNLLVADNQTRDYQNGTSERREYLSGIAWGHESNIAQQEG